jgi:hypothetical protein
MLGPIELRYVTASRYGCKVHLQMPQKRDSYLRTDQVKNTVQGISDSGANQSFRSLVGEGKEGFRECRS